MNTRTGFLRTTLIGGVLYLIPVVLLLALLGKAMQIAHQVSPPILQGVEAAHLGHILSPQVIAVLLLLCFCLLAGLFSQTVLGRRISAGIDGKLGNLPGYSFYKGVGDSLVGAEPEGMRRTVMVSIEDAWQIGMVVDELEDGLIAVYVPAVPEAHSGSLFFMEPDRVVPLSIGVKTAMQTLRRMGVGSRASLKGERIRGSTPSSRSDLSRGAPHA